jgi:hypothetical protein
MVGFTARNPLFPFVPDQPPPAVHEVALVDDQDTIELLPTVIVAGLAVNFTVGGDDLEGSLNTKARSVSRDFRAPMESFDGAVDAVRDELAASTSDDASTNDWSPMATARALTSRGLALRSE